MSDIAHRGFEDYKLGKDYGPDKAGTVIQVDGERKKWLDEHGYGKLPKPISPELPTPLRRRRSLTPGEEE